MIPSITFWSAINPKTTDKNISEDESVSVHSVVSSEETQESHLNPSYSSGTFDISNHLSVFKSVADHVLQFPTIVNGQTMFSGVPFRPVAAALGQPIPVDHMSSVASQLTSHMSKVTSPLRMMVPNLRESLAS